MKPISELPDSKQQGIEHEMLSYFNQLDELEKASFVGMLRRFVNSQKEGKAIRDEKHHPILFPPGTSFSDKVLYGVKKALRKLCEETAAKGGSLVIKRDGEIQNVPAKELLKTLPEV
ncbi:hypothetical protein GCM10011386_36050 [Parapedobacter defluvii]|uniref:Uncharacterized protein n=1 Tax=Parapedobacter defluvii TaxID=2045106 RepID=A0ABQ1MJF0_9SPHI|nr:hypothetical protein [Parapedobacter defluvii]GGC40776.1 hypothetical protein GCM10011386_36050 [Parapedobacter defluvii]